MEEKQNRRDIECTWDRCFTIDELKAIQQALENERDVIIALRLGEGMVDYRRTLTYLEIEISEVLKVREEMYHGKDKG